MTRALICELAAAIIAREARALLCLAHTLLSYVVDGDGGMNNRLLKIDNSGNVVASSTNINGTLPGQFNIPHNIVMDDMRRLWVADRANKRIQVRTGSAVDFSKV